MQRVAAVRRLPREVSSTLYNVDYNLLPTNMYTDNTSELTLAESDTTTGRMECIEDELFHGRNCQGRGQIVLEYVGRTHQKADLLRKAIGKESSVRFCAPILGPAA